ncbi:SMI1/KNR4 family protein [Methylobacterium sp. A54F]
MGRDSDDTVWAEIFTTLRQGHPSSEADLARAEAELGFSLPESYRGFCRTCGAGLAGGQIRIATPVPFEAADLVTRAGLIAHSVGEAIRLVDANPTLGFEPHRFDVEGGEAEVLERACFFGTTEDGAFLFWDVQGTGEFDVWVLAADLESVRFGGEDLTEFFRRVQGAAAAQVLGPGAEPLPPHFEGTDTGILARAGEAGAPS